MSSFALKIIAVVTMTIDHIGYVFFPNAAIFRIIGRIAFPLYAFMLTEGLKYTKSRAKYALRLAIFAAISEVPFDMAFRLTPFYPDYQNVFVSLTLGLLAIWAIDYLRSRDARLIWTAPLIAAVFGFVAWAVKCDYSWYCVLLITAPYLCRDSKIAVAAAVACLAIFYALFENSPVTAAEILAIPFILAYNGKKGYDSNAAKIGFYAFYPAHLLALRGAFALIWGV